MPLGKEQNVNKNQLTQEHRDMAENALEGKVNMQSNEDGASLENGINAQSVGGREESLNDKTDSEIAINGTNQSGKLSQDTDANNIVEAALNIQLNSGDGENCQDKNGAMQREDEKGDLVYQELEQDNTFLNQELDRLTNESIIGSITEEERNLLEAAMNYFPTPPLGTPKRQLRSVVKSLRGFDNQVVFLENVDSKYECLSCHQIMRYPRKLNNCEHRVCSSCMIKLLR